MSLSRREDPGELCTWVAAAYQVDVCGDVCCLCLDRVEMMLKVLRFVNES